MTCSVDHYNRVCTKVQVKRLFLWSSSFKKKYQVRVSSDCLSDFLISLTTVITKTGGHSTCTYVTVVPLNAKI
jgi:hypothetical protein